MRKKLEFRQFVARMRRLLLACMPYPLMAALLPSSALAQGEGMINGPFLDQGPSDEAEVEAADVENEQVEPEQHQKRRILPFLADAARKRGVVLPRTFGIGAVYVITDSMAVGDQLAISVAAGNNEPSENLIELPQVRAENLGTRVNSGQVAISRPHLRAPGSALGSRRASSSTSRLMLVMPILIRKPW
jgi:hypothetical protein